MKNAPLRSRFAALVVALLLAPASSWAEGRLRIAEQFGITFLILNVAQDQQLIEKRGKAAGLDIRVEFVKLSGGASINDTLLSGSIDVGGAGLGPILTLWDRTLGRQDVHVVASLGNLPYRLITINPKVRTIADFGDQDRIALPSVSVSVQSRLLQMATAKQFGDGQFDRFDRLQVALPHPEATAALLKGGSEIDAHFSSAPFQEQEVAGNPRAHAILSSYDVLGGPASAALLYATARFRNDNPKTYRALLDGLADAVRLIHDDPALAADIFIRTNRSGIDRALLLKIIRGADVEYKLTPQKTLPLAEFMYRIGALKHRPASAKDYVFDDPQNVEAN